MTRRGLITTAGAAGATLLTGSRLTFPRETAAQTPVVPGSDFVEEASIPSLQKGLDAGEFSVTEVVEASLARIQALDQQGPFLNAMLELNPDAMEIAAGLDEELAQGQKRGPLHGIPVIIKDIFATADAMHTTSGSLALVDNTVIRDAFVVEQLRNAGMVILGKSNMSEWSNFRGTVPSGWSSRGGLTVNPYVTTHTAMGSSTGSAVAVAASYAPVAMGVETDGSIICPASACGVVGLKPTVGLVSRCGTLGISFTQDSPGPMGRSVEDVAYVLEAIAGYDPEDMAFGEMGQFSPAARFAEFPVPDVGTRSYVKGLESSTLEGVRVGVVRSLFGFDPVTDAHVEETIRAMREAGAEIVDEIWIESYGSIADGYGESIVLTTEFSYNFHTFLASYMPDGPITSLEDVITFYWEHQEETQFWGEGDGLLDSLFLTPEAIYDPGYQEQIATNHLSTRDEGIDLVMDENQLDVLIAPSAGLPTEIDAGETPGSSTQIAAMAGYPSLTLPIGYTNGLPAGLHMFGRAFSERKLLRYGHALERVLNVRRPPQYLSEIPWGE